MKYILPLIATLLLNGCTQKNSAQPQEVIPAGDYQHCLDAEKMGGGEAIEARCGKLQQEIEHTH